MQAKRHMLTTAEKIKDRQEKIAAAELRIQTIKERIEKWKQEVEMLQSMEIKGLLQEIDLPIDRVKEFLSDMAKGKVGNGYDVKEE